VTYRLGVRPATTCPRPCLALFALLALLALPACGPPPPPAAPPAPPPHAAPPPPPVAGAPTPAPDPDPAPAPAPAAPGPTTVQKLVVRVVDGDTVVLEGRERVRVANINAPEIDEELGLESRNAAVALCQGKTARITGSTRDGYGRLVGDVEVGGQSLSALLVQKGLAHVYLIPPVDTARAARLLELEAEARRARRGIWGTERYRGPLHFTSFHANPRGDERDDLNSEYVRIANVSGAPHPLKGYTLVNRKGLRFYFPRLTVPAGYTVMVMSGAGEPQLDPARQLKLYWNRRFPVWSNRGDTATLLDPRGHPVDSVTYDPHPKKVYPK
jgi:endonuclease YncB( thermonuclease family)